ncbi:hypothetical protein AAKU61_004447 [Undibacterium sp. GrIS 1.2]|uniref:hypothetical protein n=1 Tax=Undibacterium sp. GrIS 1.2 TaxID=3143933 RepID=UPI00339A0306
MNHLYGIVLYAVVICVIGYVWYQGSVAGLHRDWLSRPTLEEYWKQHPECKTRSGTQCYHCHSRAIRQYGWSNRSDHRRYFQCNQCNRTLYRS